MSKADRPQVVVLCEDRAQYHFVRKCLQLRGVARVTPSMSPCGRGSAEQWVRERYPREVRAYRSKANHLNIALAVMVDADKSSVTDRKKQLDGSSAMRDGAQEPRRAEERIAIFVPKRNIETWFRFLDGQPWNEDDSYRSPYRDARPVDYAQAMDKLCGSRGLGADSPPSLVDACAEWERLGLP